MKPVNPYNHYALIKQNRKNTFYYFEEFHPLKKVYYLYQTIPNTPLKFSKNASSSFLSDELVFSTPPPPYLQHHNTMCKDDDQI